MSAENAANSSGAAANATRAKDDSNESTVPVTPRANGGGGSGSSGSKRLASQTSPLEAERRRLAEEFDGSYWNSASLSRRRSTPQRLDVVADVPPSSDHKVKKPKKAVRRVPLARYLATQLDGDYWSAGLGDRRRMVRNFVDRSLAIDAANAAAADADDDDAPPRRSRKQAKSNRRRADESDAVDNDADNDQDDDDDDDDDIVVQEEPSVLITRSVVESPTIVPLLNNAIVPSGVVLADMDIDHDAAVAPVAGTDLNADVSDDEENEDYDAKGNLLYSVPPCDRVGLNDGMDGLYWLLSGEVRPRRAREVHTYGSDHIKVYRNKKPVVLTPEQEAARREQQQRRQAEERAARERSLEAYMERVKFESEGFPILDSLWLGSRHVIANQAWMLASGIDSVVNLTTKRFHYVVADTGRLEVVTIAIDDSGHAADAFLGAMARVCDQIDAWLGQGRTVMVHCQHGLSRSPAALIAYLVARKKYTLQKAYDHVDAARRGLRINDGFLRALMSWELDRNPNLRQSTLKRYARGGKGMADSEANATGALATQALVAVTDE